MNNLDILPPDDLTSAQVIERLNQERLTLIQQCKLLSEERSFYLSELKNVESEIKNLQLSLTSVEKQLFTLEKKVKIVHRKKESPKPISIHQLNAALSQLSKEEIQHLVNEVRNKSQNPQGD